MRALVRLVTLALAAIFGVMCGTAGPSSPASEGFASGSPASGPIGSAPAVAATVGTPPTPAPTLTACPSPARRAAALPSRPTGSVAAFAGENGASKVVAFVESVDLAGQRITLTFPNSSTGGLATPAAAISRVTVRVTSASVLQQVVASEMPLTAPVPVAGTKLTIASGAPALPARAPVVVIGLDQCGVITSTVRTTLTQPVAAGSTEWTIATPLGTLLPTGAVVSSALVPLALSDLNEGDVLVGSGGALIFGLVFSGRAPDYVLTRLLRPCRHDPCPAPPA